MSISTVGAARPVTPAPQRGAADQGGFDLPIDLTPGQRVGVMVGAGAVGALALGVGTHAMVARSSVAERQQGIIDAKNGLAAAQEHEVAMGDALRADRVHPPEGTSAADAVAWARQRFGGGDSGWAYTDEHTRADLHIARWGEPTKLAGEAEAAAHGFADGNAGGVVRAGEWYVPVRFAQDLDPREKTRQVPYEVPVYDYHFGPNPQKGGQMDYHMGWHTETRYRTERYLDPFEAFKAAHDGLDKAFTDDHVDLRYLGTAAEDRLREATSAVAGAEGDLAHAEGKLRYATGRASAVVAGVAAGTALLAGGTVAAVALAND